MAKIANMKSIKDLVPSEHDEQAAFFGWLNFLCRSERDKTYLLAYAVPNGGPRAEKGSAGKRKAMLAGKKLKAEGLKPGVPDVVWPVARYPFHGLYMEFKRRKGGRVEPEQRHYLESLTEQGYLALAVKGCDAAKDVFNLYRKLWPWGDGNIKNLRLTREQVTKSIIDSCGKGVFKPNIHKNFQ